MKPAVKSILGIVPIVAIAVVMAVIISRFTHRQTEVPLKAEVGKVAPDFTLPALSGESVTLSSKRGKVVVLDFWATWCPPCVEGMPITEQIVERFAERGVELIAVNVGERPEVVKAFFDQRQVKGTAVLGGDTSVDRAYKVQYLPQLVVIDRQGVLRAVAALTPDELEEWLAPAIESALKSGEASGK